MSVAVEGDEIANSGFKVSNFVLIALLDPFLGTSPL
jgi:hypothetical protein